MTPITAQERPFTIEHRRKALSPAHFAPEARVSVGEALRTGGLLSALSDEQARTLLTLLTFLTPNGAVQASAWQLAMALHLREGKARDRLERLCALTFRGRPVAYRLDRESGPTAYALSRFLVDQEEEEPQPEPPTRPPVALAGREVVIARSREKYAVTREEAEALVAAQYAPVVRKDEDPDAPEAGAKLSLRGLGVTEGEIEHLLANYPLAEVERQLAWLPARNARDPRRLIVAAIKGRYEPPVPLRKPLEIPKPDAESVAPPVADDAAVSLPIPEAPLETGGGGE